LSEGATQIGGGRAHGYWGRWGGGGAEKSGELVACSADRSAVGLRLAELLRVQPVGVGGQGVGGLEGADFCGDVGRAEVFGEEVGDAVAG